MQGVLDLFGRAIFPTPDDQVFLAASDDERIVLGANADVSQAPAWIGGQVGVFSRAQSRGCEADPLASAPRL
jgi:hypothetical protein